MGQPFQLRCLLQLIQHVPGKACQREACHFYAGAVTPQEVANARAPQLPKGQALHQPVIAHMGKGLNFAPASQQVRFGDSPQDVCSALGSPSSTVQKSAVPARRHKQPKTALALDYFYTYADRCTHCFMEGLALQLATQYYTVLLC